MRAILQRVLRGSVTVEGKVVSSIGRGLVVLVGIEQSDTEKDAEFIGRKILNARLWENEESGKAWDRSVVDRKFELLIVSQFTLHAVMKGNKPDFHLSMKADQSKAFYEKFLARVRSAYEPAKVQEGEFGAMMTVDLANDGPVSIWLDSRTKE
eukprot:TRINITY_DN20614_c0_g1_i1.p1 TRINITY_DN20614_c0_g1~~TRINITY_DN20614_c0_g1_i1.p1  ORF type:complete len:153 (-),score=29.72 TRINITY_DN20614_c0_g1_i1:95-553(-)